MRVADMKALCMADSESLIADFERSREEIAYFDLGAIAEVLVLSTELDTTRSLRERFSVAALEWLRDGLFEDATFVRLDYLYHATLFCYLAGQAPGFRPADVAHINSFWAGGMAGRSEQPVLTSETTAALLAACGIELDPEPLVTRDLRLVIDKRVLRARSDEHDIQTLTMAAQLCRVGDRHRDRLPRIFPQALLVQAIQLGHVNWIAIGALLCATTFGMPAWLRSGADEALASHLEQATGLLPPPAEDFVENDHVKRAERGLRIRSSIASYALLDA
jgi:hypothetical protein